MGIKVLTPENIKREQEWYIPNILPKGHLTLLAGESGIGKSSLTAFFATKVSSATKVGFYLLEDDPSSYVNKIGVPPNVQYFDFTGEHAASYLPSVVELRQLVTEFHLNVLVLDPIAILCKKMNDAGEVRELLTPLEALCQETGCCILGVHHFSKGNGRAKDLATGSHAWVATVRHSLSLAADSEGQVYLGVTKSNIAATGQAWQAVKEVDRYCMRITGLVEAEEGAIQAAISSLYENKAEGSPTGRKLLELYRDLGTGEFTQEDLDSIGVSRQSFSNFRKKAPKAILVEGNVNKNSGARAKYYFAADFEKYC